MIDSGDYLGATDLSEKDEVAIINTDTADEADQIVELPRADDRTSTARPVPLRRTPGLRVSNAVADESLKELVLPPLPEDPPILEDAVHTWSIDAWQSLSKKEHGPVFQAGGYPWCVAPLGCYFSVPLPRALHNTAPS